MFLGLFIFLISVYGINSIRQIFPCTTPNNESASCISLFSCPILLKSLGSSDSTAVNFVKKSICSTCEVEDVGVCCGTVGNYLHPLFNRNQIDPLQPSQNASPEKPGIFITTPFPNSKAARREYVKTKLIPSRRICGFQHTDDRFYEDTRAALYEFPWLVHVKASELNLEEEYGDRCNGVLISDRYVLTDAFCGWDATVVKLGQYNTGSNVSCVGNPDYGECTDPSVFVQIEEKIISGKYTNGAYDFTLLRLKEKISYSDFVRPICLPVDGTFRPRSNPTLIFSGWGATGPNELVKKHLYYNVTDENTCYQLDTDLESNIKHAHVSFACLIPKENNADLACQSEHGGPLMYKHRHQWFVDGVVIAAYAKDGDRYVASVAACSNQDPVTGIFITPGFMDWILDNVRD